jgi:hypothetical protein
MVGAAVGRRLGDPALREQLRVTRSGVVRAALLASGWAMAPLLLAAVLSAAGWTLVAFVDAGRSRFPSPLAIWLAHALVVSTGAAFAVWGLALSLGRVRQPGGQGTGAGARHLYCLLPITYCLLAAGPALVGPLLPHLARPERALDATLLVNPITSVGAALGMDLLRSPRVYGLTRAPEYWYVYPPAVAVVAIYIAAAGLGAQQLRRRLESE